jgi:hypothetical protein
MTFGDVVRASAACVCTVKLPGWLMKASKEDWEILNGLETMALVVSEPVARLTVP